MPIEAALPVVGVVLLGYACASFPSSLANGGAARAAISAGALFTYVAVFITIRRSRSEAVQQAIRFGRPVGLGLAAAAVLGHSVEVFGALAPPLPALLGVGTWALMFLLLGAAAAEAARHGRSILVGMASSVWAAMISASATVLYALSLGLMFMSRMQHVLNGPPSLVVRNMLDGAMSHLLLAPVVAIGAGAATGLAYFIVRSVRRRTAVMLTAGAALVCGGGITALRVASTLPRSDRPPYVMLGLLALAIGLTSLAALFAAVRRQS